GDAAAGEAEVPGLVDRAHAAGAEEAHDLVGAGEDGAWCETAGHEEATRTKVGRRDAAGGRRPIVRVASFPAAARGRSRARIGRSGSPLAPRATGRAASWRAARRSGRRRTRRPSTEA